MTLAKLLKVFWFLMSRNGLVLEPGPSVDKLRENKDIDENRGFRSKNVLQPE